MRMASVISILFATTFLTLVPCSADDWPQWLGPQRDSVWRETGIVERFPENGPAVQWRTPVAWGYSGPAVADGRVYVMDYVKREGRITNNPGGADGLEGTERVLCLSSETGEVLWTFQYDRPYNFSYGGGPRCTPTVDGDRVYALGAEGNLSCLNARTGELIWSKDFVQDYGAATPYWGVAAHPLVDGDVLYCVVGGEGSVAVAFDKHTGRELWRALSAPMQGYCPPTLIEHAGRRQLLIWHSEALNSLDPRTGERLWSVPLSPSLGMAIAAPRKLGDYLLATAYNEVAALLKLDDTRPAAEVVWQGDARNAVYCANSTPFLENGMIYGCDVNSGALMGVRLDNAERVWQTFDPTLGPGARRGRYGTAFLVKQQDRFFLFSETGDLILANLSPDGYEELDRAHILEPTNHTFGRPVVWSHPAFAEKSMFVRNDKELVRVNLAKDEG
jgi:outer membrane protein assembly factor BamB